MNTAKTILLFALGLVPALALMVTLLLRQWWRTHHKGYRCPLQDKLLRPPGESLRLKIEDLNDDVAELVFVAVCVPLIMVPLFFRYYLPGAFFVIAVFSLYCVWRAVRLARTLGNCRLGFNGERAVGEELNQLMLDGCHVFHDFPADSKWNIDHIVVAPSGVYAIETKTRRKQKAPAGRKEYEVNYDGKALSFPHCTDSYGLEQASTNAKWLSGFLSSAVGERVTVEPVLTLPGWFINRTAHDGISVLNPKEIRGFVIHQRGPCLTEKQMKQIAHQLEQKCRDVEF